MNLFIHFSVINSICNVPEKLKKKKNILKRSFSCVILDKNRNYFFLNKIFVHGNDLNVINKPNFSVNVKISPCFFFFFFPMLEVNSHLKMSKTVIPFILY